MMTFDLQDDVRIKLQEITDEHNRDREIFGALKSLTHPVVPMSLPGGVVNIDEEMAPFIYWLHSLKGVGTEWCCQGDIAHSAGTRACDAYVVWTSTRQDSARKILKSFDNFYQRFHQNKADRKQVMHFHKQSQIRSEVEYFTLGDNPHVRYISRWYDNYSFNQYLEWMGLKNEQRKGLPEKAKANPGSAVDRKKSGRNSRVRPKALA